MCTMENMCCGARKVAKAAVEGASQKPPRHQPYEDYGKKLLLVAEVQLSHQRAGKGICRVSGSETLTSCGTTATLGMA